MAKDIVLATINAKWIHPSLALRLLKANLGHLEDSCRIIEFNLRQPLAEMFEFFAGASLHILGFSVSVWNHQAALELFGRLERVWAACQRPVVVLGGPEVSHLPPDAKIFQYADYVVRGEGEKAFKELCGKILSSDDDPRSRSCTVKSPVFINAENVDVNKINSAYHLYTDEDLAKKLVYVEASRGCPFNCEFCLSAVKSRTAPLVREFLIEPLLAQMDELVRRGAKTFKFLDRSFNADIKRAVKIMEFFLKKIEERKGQGLVVHFEMAPSLFPPQLREILTGFPPGTLRLEVGIQTLNSETAALIERPSNPEKELETLRFLCEKTGAVIHTDLIAGLPGEGIASFKKGFNTLWGVLSGAKHVEIQLGILKLLPGAPISRHNETFGMRYSASPPYEVEETSAMSADDLNRIKNFARFWEIIINRRLINPDSPCTVNPWSAPVDEVFDRFMALSDALFAHFGRNWGIGKYELLEKINSVCP